MAINNVASWKRVCHNSVSFLYIKTAKKLNFFFKNLGFSSPGLYERELPMGNVRIPTVHPTALSISESIHKLRHYNDKMK